MTTTWYADVSQRGSVAIVARAVFPNGAIDAKTWYLASIELHSLAEQNLLPEYLTLLAREWDAYTASRSIRQKA